MNIYVILLTYMGKDSSGNLLAGKTVYKAFRDRKRAMDSALSISNTEIDIPIMGKLEHVHVMADVVQTTFFCGDKYYPRKKANKLDEE